jgi:hypothetical protein
LHDLLEKEICMLHVSVFLTPSRHSTNEIGFEHPLCARDYSSLGIQSDKLLLLPSVFLRLFRLCHM